MTGQNSAQVTHWAGSQKKLEQRDPICGDAGDDPISLDGANCTCVFCLDWIRPDHDWNKTVEQPK